MNMCTYTVAPDRCHSKYGGYVDPCSELRMPVDTPAQLQFAFEGSTRYRRTTNLFDMLRSDLEEKDVKWRSGRDHVRRLLHPKFYDKRLPNFGG